MSIIVRLLSDLLDDLLNELRGLLSPEEAAENTSLCVSPKASDKPPKPGSNYHESFLIVVYFYNFFPILSICFCVF